MASTPGETPRSSGMAAVLSKMERSVADGKYYEAQQMYKTLYHRYVGQKKAGDARELLLSGIRTMLSARQINEALELSKLLLDLLQSASVKGLAVPDPLGALESMFGSWLKATSSPSSAVSSASSASSASPAASSASSTSSAPVSDSADSAADAASAAKLEALVTDFEALSKSAFKWATAQFGPAALGTLHGIAAEFFWRTAVFHRSQRHFVRQPGSGERMASMLSDWLRLGDVPADEHELLLTRPVLQYLSVGNLRDANALFSAFPRVHAGQPAVSGPLVNFTRFLLLTLERDALPLFQELRQRYKPFLDRDPAYAKYLDQVANVFYKVPIPKPAPPGGLGGLMGDLMRSFMAPPGSRP